MPDYSGHYATLGVSPQTDWKTLRSRYRQLIKRWHPDRFSTEPEQRRQAEERTKEITLAYQALERYWRDNGVLPPLPQASAPVRPVVSRAGAEAGASPVGGPARRFTPWESEREAGVPQRRRARRRMSAVLAVAAVCAALYIVSGKLRERPQLDELETAEQTPTPQPPAPPTQRKRSAERGPGIKVGSTFGDVYAIQGVPTSSSGDTWTYGKSRIHFVDGKVTSWEEHLDNPLRVERQVAHLLHAGFFGIGSTKREVRATQGPPTMETDRVWYYGPSKVYFDRDRVVRWEESPVQPLRAVR